MKADKKTAKLSQLRPAGVIGVASALLGVGTAHAVETGALPQNPTMVGGSASFAQSGRTLTVNQSTNRTVIDWRSFDIGSGATTVFNQPNAGSIAVNRVNGSTNPTQIEGALRANGQVWILNPNGVLFGKTARVDVAGLLASTANIDAARFMAGDTRLAFNGADHGEVVNEGSISVAQSGLAAFVAPSVRNSGVITATVGKVSLAAGDTFTLDLAGDHLVELGLGSGNAVVDQSGRIVDAGGVVALSARSAGQVVDSVINMSGVVDVSSARAAGGQIVLGADDIATAAGAVLKADGAGAGGQIIAVANKTGDYAGSFSARGGGLGGDGGHVETSGATVHIADGISVDTRAAAGATGVWTIDPDNLVIGDTDSGVDSDPSQSISAATVVTALNTASLDLKAKTSITVNTAIDASAQSNSNTLHLVDEDADGHLTVNLNAPITLGAHQHLVGDADVVNLTNGARIQNGIDVALAGATVHLKGGTYAPGTSINKSNLTLVGEQGAEIDVDPGSAQVDAVSIGGATSGVTVEDLTIKGEITGSYIDYAFGSGQSRGIGVVKGATNFTLTGNTITNVRNGILIDGRTNTGSVTDNFIDNTKSGISIQYTDGTGIDITGNSQGTFGNEWGLNLHLNGNYDGVTVHANPTTGKVLPTDEVQLALLADSANNDGWSVQDQAYTGSNRTSVVVATTGSSANQGSPRAPLDSIQAGIAAVVAGGVVNVEDGTYVIAPGGGNYINVNKSLSLIGESEDGVIIDARGASTYGLRVTAQDGPVDLENFTLYGVTASGGYGLKAEATQGLTISNVTSQGSAKSEFDLNGVVGATLDHLTADGASVATGAPTDGNGISFTDSQDITLTNSVTRNNNWGGLALYQSNNRSGYLLQETNITVDASNSFGEANPVYAEDQSSTNDFGTLNISGFDYLVKSPTNPADVYTWFQKTQQGAIDWAASISPTTAYVEGFSSSLTGDNTFFVGTSTGGQALSIQTAINAALTGATVNVGNGTYVIAPGGGNYINIDKSLSLIGASQTGVIIDARNASTYGLRVTAQDGPVDLENFTLYGVTASGGYGLKAEATQGLTITNVTSQGSAKSEFDLNGVVGATLDHLTADGASVATGTPTDGNGISLTDSQDITLTNSVTRNNNWGGLALYQSNNRSGYLLQETNITVDASNSFGEANPVYAEDQSSTNDFGTLNISGFDYLVKSPTNPADVYTWFQKNTGQGAQGAIDWAASISPTTAYVEGYGSGLTGNNTFYVGTSTGGQALSIQTALDIALTGATVNVGAGTYGEALDIEKSVSLLGAGAGLTVIKPVALFDTQTAHNGDADVKTAVFVNGVSGVELSGLTIDGNGLAPNAIVFWNNASGSIADAAIQGYGTFSGAQTGQGLAVDAAAGGAVNLNLSNVTFTGWNTNAIDAVTGNGATSGGGDITLTVSGSTFTGQGPTGLNAQNGILLWERGGGAINATVDGSTFSNIASTGADTAAGVLMYGSPNGQLSVTNSSFSNVQYYIALEGGSPNGVTPQGNTYDGVSGDTASLDQLLVIENHLLDAINDPVNGLIRLRAGQIFVTADKGDIEAAIQKADAGDIINIENGTYVVGPGAGGDIDIDKSLSLIGQSQAGVVIDARNASTYGLRVTAQDGPVDLENFTLYGVTASGGYGLKAEATQGLTIRNVTSQGAFQAQFDLTGVVGATLDHLTADGASVAAGLAGAGVGISFTDSQDITLTDAVTRNNLSAGLALHQADSLQETGITVDASNSFGEANPVYAEDMSSSNDFGALNISGFDFLVKSPTNPADVYTWFQKTRQGAIDFAASISPTTAYVEGFSSGLTGDNTFSVGISTGGQALSIQAAVNGALAGATVDVDSGSYGGDVTVSTPITLNLGQVVLGGGFTLASGGAGSGLSGSLAAASINLGAPAVLNGDLTLDTSASGGSITIAALDAAGSGAPNLTVDAGAGALSLGALGAASRLGAVQIASSATLMGSDYKGASLSFGGDVTLTQASTTLDTSGAGAITVAGSVLGSADGQQSLTLAAGPGTGAASANGDISLQNVGQLGLALGALTISGDDFSAQTVRIAGDFKSQLTGNQVFSSHTLDAGGSVDSSVGGNASGPINAGQDVSVNVAGDLTGSITATNVDLTANSLTNATVNASQSASASASSVSGSTVAGDTVNVTAGSVSGATLTGSTVTAQADNFSGTVNASNSATVTGGDISGAFTGATVSLNASGALSGATVNASQNASVTAGSVSGSTVAAGNTVNLNAGSVSGTSLTGSTVTAQADNFDGSVSASNTATVTGGNISGSFNAGSLSLTGSGSVNASINATNVSIDAPTGNVTGNWQNLDTGSNGGGGIVISKQQTASEVDPNQLVVENFALPAGTVVTDSGALVLPQGLVLSLLSPVGAGGAPKLIQVQTVQELGSLLAEGYTAIVIDLSSREAPAKAKGKTVKVSQK